MITNLLIKKKTINFFTTLPLTNTPANSLISFINQFTLEQSHGACYRHMCGSIFGVFVWVCVLVYDVIIIPTLHIACRGGSGLDVQSIAATTAKVRILIAPPHSAVELG